MQLVKREAKTVKLAYNSQEPCAEAKDLAGSIVELILCSGVTYAQADAALEEAQRRLYAETRPISAGLLHPGGSEQTI